MSTLPPLSPCIKVCSVDERGLCLGCGRTLEEIARWSVMSPTEQWAVVHRAAERRRAALRVQVT